MDSSYTTTQVGTWFSAAQHWEVLDFQDYLVFNNGNQVLVKDGTTGLWSLPSSSSFPYAKSMLNFKGQIVQGNTTDGTNWLRWSNIGQATFTLDSRNTAGYGPLPITGPIHRLMYLSTGQDVLGRDRGAIVCYAEKGVVITKAYSEPTSAFGFDVSNEQYGISDWGCVGGSNHEHVFIDNRGFLHKLTAKGDEVLGYQEFMEPLLTESPRIIFDHLEQQYYISTESACYVLNKYGLGKLTQYPTTGWNSSGIFNVVSDIPTALAIDIASDAFDFGIRARKLITSVALGVETDGVVTVSALVRYAPNSAYIQTPWVPLNNRGTCMLNVQGIDFKLCIRCSGLTTFKLDEAIARWKLIDKVNIRGMYGNAKASSGAD